MVANRVVVQIEVVGELVRIPGAVVEGLQDANAVGTATRPCGCVS